VLTCTAFVLPSAQARTIVKACAWDPASTPHLPLSALQLGSAGQAPIAPDRLVSLLEFCSRDGASGELVGLPLLPLASGNVALLGNIDVLLNDGTMSVSPSGKRIPVGHLLLPDKHRWVHEDAKALLQPCVSCAELRLTVFGPSVLVAQLGSVLEEEMRTLHPIHHHKVRCQLYSIVLAAVLYRREHIYYVRYVASVSPPNDTLTLPPFL
jgi:hypothetical protein